MDTSGKDLESQRRAMVTQQKIKRLEQENNIYKQRLLEISRFVNIRSELDQYLRKQDIKNLLEVPLSSSISSNSDISSLNSEHVNGNVSNQLLDFGTICDNTNGNGKFYIFEHTLAYFLIQFKVLHLCHRDNLITHLRLELN